MIGSTKDHEWVRLSGGVAEVGVTDYAQQQLGDVVYVELPDGCTGFCQPARLARSSR